MSKFISLTGLSEFLTKCRALFYTKPNGGVPKTDLAQSVQTSLGKADSAYQKPNSGIPKTDLASGVQSSLDLADSSVQANPVGSVTPAVDPYDYATREELSQLGQEVNGANIALTGTTESGKYIDKYGAKGDNASFKIVAFDVSDCGKLSVQVPSSATQSTPFYCFYTSSELTTKVGDAASTSTLAGSTTEMTVPAGAAYLAISIVSTQDAVVSNIVAGLTERVGNLETAASSLAERLGDVEDDAEGSKAITDYIARFDNEWFSVDGIWDATGASDFPYSPAATKSTPILPLTDDIFIRCYLGTSSTNNKYGIVFFDENKQFMSGASIYATEAGLNDVHLTSANIPAGAKYFSAPTLKSTGYLDKSYLEIRLDSVYLEKLNQIGIHLGQIDTHLERIDTHLEQIDEQLVWSNALSGLIFDDSEQHQLAKTAIKAAWLTYGPNVNDSQKAAVDALYETLKTTKLYITYLYNVEGTYGCFLRIDDAAASGNNCFSKYVAGIHTITGDEEVWDITCKSNTILWPSGSTLTNAPFAIHFAIDWNELNDETVTKPEMPHPIQINFGELNWGGRIETKDIHNKVEELEQAITPISSIDLTGKKIVCIGDSLTEMVDTTNSKHYSDYIAERTGGTFINIGFGGTQLRQRRAMAADFDALPESTESEIAEKSRYAYATIDIINLVKAIAANDFTEQTKAVNWLANHNDDNTAILARVKAIDWSTVDGVTIFAGTNDWPSNVATIGTSGSTDVNYTLGAVNEIIRLLLSTFKHLKLYWFTPVVRWIDYASGTGLDADWGDVKVYSQDNGNLRYFSEQVMKEVLLNHIPCCDLYNTLGWNKNNFSTYFPANDGTHPRTLAGVQSLAKKIGAFILANNTL